MGSNDNVLFELNLLNTFLVAIKEAMDLFSCLSLRLRNLNKQFDLFLKNGFKFFKNWNQTNTHKNPIRLGFGFSIFWVFGFGLGALQTSNMIIKKTKTNFQFLVRI
jgi:hypothetical protein